MKKITALFIPALFMSVVLVVGYFIFFGSPQAEEAFGKLPDLQLRSVVAEDTETENLVDKIIFTKKPTMVKVYKKPEKIKIETILEKLNFKGKPRDLGKTLMWTSGEKFIRYNSTLGMVTFSDEKSKLEGNLNKDQAVVKAKNFLKNLGIISTEEHVIVKNIKQLLKEKSHLGEVSYGQTPNVYAVYLGMKIDGFNVVSSNGDDSLIEVWVGIDGSILKAVAPTTPLVVLGDSTYKIKSLEGVTKQLGNGEGVIVDADGSLRTEEKFQIRYNRSTVSYLFEGSGKYFQPAFLFDGYARGDQFLVNLVTVLPAVENSGKNND